MSKTKITNKISKRALIMIACIWIIISFLVVRYTYAKYITSVDANTSVDISNWTIFLNTQDITNNSDFSQNLSLSFPADTYREANAIVPGAIRICRFNYKFISSKSSIYLYSFLCSYCTN